MATKQPGEKGKVGRQRIFDKYGGCCAYCGCELQKGWHVDHLKPIVRNYKSERVMDDASVYGYEWKKKYVGNSHPENEMFENLMPSCASCNNYKSTFGLDLFRQEIGQLIGRLNKTITIYKIAKRFGLIQETSTKVKFYFETFNSNKQQTPKQ